MLQLTFEHDYLTIDTGTWIEDRTDTQDEAAQAFETFCEDRTDEPVSALVLEWLGTLNAAGIYGEGDPVQVCTVNEESFLDSDIILTFARTEAHGPLFIWQHGYYTYASATVLAFNGDDDSEAFSWASGGAKCSEDTCTAEWLVQDACTIWLNGGGETHRVAELADEDGTPRCPHDGGTLTFYAD